MKKNQLISIVLIIAVGLGSLIYLLITRQNIDKPVALGSQGSLVRFRIDDLIKGAELIIIGEVTETLPSRWVGNAEGDPQNASAEEVSRARGLFTDSLISIDQVLKGDIGISPVRVRTFTGQTQRVLWRSDSEPSYIVGKTYLLFLIKDDGRTEEIDPGDYIAVGALQGVYEIVDGKASSKVDEWDLDELIAYIEKSLSADPVALTATPVPNVLATETLPSNENIPDTAEAKEIMETVQKAYDIEDEAAYTFDLSKFPTVFINDPRFPLNSKNLETVRELTNNPSLESAEYLDYKMAYYSWRRDSTIRSEAVHATAQAENRALTEEEYKSLIDPYGRIAPARAQSPIRQTPLTFLSVEIDGDIATVVVDDVLTVSELTLVQVDKKWYIAAYKALSVSP